MRFQMHRKSYVIFHINRFNGLKAKLLKDKSVVISIKPGIHVATDCNAKSLCSQMQHVWGSVAVSRRYLTVSDISFDDQSRCKSSQRVCRGVVSTRTHENMFYIIYFFADEGVPVSCIALPFIAACMCSSFRYL